jgi:hypothetical protein
MPAADWIYILAVVGVLAFGELVILSVRRQYRRDRERQGEEKTGR